MLILNDVHLGVQRSGGTTPASREALRSYLFKSFRNILHVDGPAMEPHETHVCILGDLFDDFEVDPRDWIECYAILHQWLSGPGAHKKLTLVPGNHDHSPKALRVSSFEMLCQVLVSQFDGQVHALKIDQWSKLDVDAGGTFALAHCSNQEVFDEKLKEILGFVAPGSRVLLHANYDNNFAAVSDHSLNVTRAQAEAFAARGATLYFAHEHQARTALGGSVVVFGNQWPTSVSDCLNNDAKYAHVMHGSVDKIETWSRDGFEHSYSELSWRDLQGLVDTPDGFIKVVGSASANEAGDCMTAIAKFRSKSSAFVITNGVKVEGVADNEALPEAFEATKAFDVMEFIYSNLDEEQRAAVAVLVGEQ